MSSKSATLAVRIPWMLGKISSLIFTQHLGERQTEAYFSPKIWRYCVRSTEVAIVFLLICPPGSSDYFGVGGMMSSYYARMYDD